jgi:riboflavin biosynthesis pyrimidine reductase
MAATDTPAKEAAPASPARDPAWIVCDQRLRLRRAAALLAMTNEWLNDKMTNDGLPAGPALTAWHVLELAAERTGEVVEALEGVEELLARARR